MLVGLQHNYDCKPHRFFSSVFSVSLFSDLPGLQRLKLQVTIATKRMLQAYPRHSRASATSSKTFRTLLGHSVGKLYTVGVRLKVPT